MLKKKRVLFLGLMVLAGSACVTPTHASSASSVVLASIQATGATGAKDEIIAIHNNTSLDVDITSWCINSKGTTNIACFDESVNPPYLTRYVLPAYGSATIVSEEHVAQSTMPVTSYSLVYKVLSQTSGSVVTSADTILLVDSVGEVIDEKVWSNSVPSGKVWSRSITSSMPKAYAATGLPTDWVLINRGELIENTVRQIIVEQESPVTPDEPLDPEVPVDEPVPSILPLHITEFLPNPDGSDLGNEFIELFNPNTTTLLIEGFRIKVGTENAKWITIPVTTLEPLEYLAIYNTDVPFTLGNSGGTLQLFKDDSPIGDPITYPQAKDGEAWSMQTAGEWLYNNTPSPGAENMPATVDVTDEDSNTPVLKPCAENQYRSPETGRCRLLAMASTQPVPCKTSQERNPETGRCRNIVTDQAPAPCKEGQERNPETNRCRNQVKMSSAGHGVLSVQTKADNQPSWYFLAAIILIIVAVIVYAVWEWRRELKVLWSRLYSKFVKGRL